MKKRGEKPDVSDAKLLHRAKSLYENTNDIIYSHDLDWNILYMNPAVERVLGYIPEDLIGKNILEFLDPSHEQPLKNLLVKKLKNCCQRSESLELIITTKDGQEKWVEVNSTFLFSPEGLPYAVQGIARDITDRKRVQQELLVSEQKYRAIFENTNSPMCIIEEDNILSLVNSEFLKMTGYSREEVEGKRTWMSFVDSRDFDRMLRFHKARMAGQGAPRNYEFRLVCKDGESKYVFITVAFIGNTRLRIISMTDLTEKKKAELLLKESETRYRTFLDATSDYAFMKDDKLRYILANRAFLEKHGFREEAEILGKNDIELFSRDFAELTGESDRRVLETDRFEVVEERVLDRIYEARKFPVTLKSDTIGIGAVIRDITEMRRAEEERKRLQSALDRARKMESLGVLAGGVAHDLNNVLGGLVSLPEILMMKLSDSDPMRRQLDIIKRSGEKAARIVQDMLTLTRRGVADATVLCLNDIIAMHFETPEHEKLQFHHPSVRFEMQLDDELPNIVGSSPHLSKTVMNLLSNAAEAMPHGGTVTLKTEARNYDKPLKGFEIIPEGHYVVISVKDEGVGIPHTDIERIFEPFYSKKVMGRSGTGLGMTVVWSTVKDHKGYIDIHSEECRGTTITLYLPATRKRLKQEKEQVPVEKYLGKGQTILIVDDVQDQLELTSSMLSRLGYKAVAVSSGEEALEYLKKNTADLVCLDMIMDPGINGLETYRRILDIHPGQKAIIASGYVEKDFFRDVKKLGVKSLIKKPFRLEDIGVAIWKELKDS